MPRDGRERLHDHVARNVTGVVAAHAIRDDPEAEIGTFEHGVFVVSPHVSAGRCRSRTPREHAATLRLRGHGSAWSAQARGSRELLQLVVEGERELLAEEL